MFYQNFTALIQVKPKFIDSTIEQNATQKIQHTPIQYECFWINPGCTKIVTLTLLILSKTETT